jgi:anti-anti-sigma regulatory factor
MFDVLKRIFGVEAPRARAAPRAPRTPAIEAGRSTPADRVMTASVIDRVLVVTFLETDVPAAHSLAAIEEIRSLLMHDSSIRDVLFDLCNVGYIDSTGLGMMVELLGVLRARGGPGKKNDSAGAGGGRIAVAASADRVQVLFKLTRLELVFIIRRTVPEAMSALVGAQRAA